MRNRKESLFTRGSFAPPDGREKPRGGKPALLCAKALGISLHLSLIGYLAALPFGRTGLLAAAPAFCLLVIFLVLSASMRFGGNLRRIRAFLFQRLSGSPMLAALPGCYLLCALMNLTYSPLKAQMLAGWPAVAGGALLWVGVLFYTQDTDRLDNLLMDVAAAGILAAGLSLAGVRAPDAGGEKQLMRVIFLGLLTGAIFFLSAQYNKTFKAVVTAGFGAVLVPALGTAAGWAAPAALTGVFGPDRRSVWLTAMDQLDGFRTPEILLGRGSGFDLTLGGAAGVHNFLLADILNGGVLRFTLGLALWLCVWYCVAMLFLYDRGVPLIYLCGMGMVFLDAFLARDTSFLSDPLFLPLCALLCAEHTLIKKGKRRVRL